MNGPASARHVVRPAFAVCLVVFSWLAAPCPSTFAAPAAPATVAAKAAAAPHPHTDRWGWKKVMGSTHTRARVIQIAVACMCFGLFILMRKLNG
jgi:hypothetical protein